MKKNLEKIQDKLLLIPIMLLAIHFIIRVADFAKIMFSYPLYSEAVTQLTQLYFLDVCGFHNYCPYWYNGFIAFLVTPPTWYFFAYPFYALSQSVLIGSYLSLIATYVIAFLAIYWLGHLLGLTPIRRVLLFLLVFANNILIKNMSFGRFHEIFAWTMFIITFLLLLRYKDRKFDSKAIFLPVFAALTMTAHQNIGILMVTLFAGLILVKRRKEQLKAVGLFVASVALSAIWLIPAFLESRKNIFATATFTSVEAWWSFPLGTVHFTSIALLVLPPITFFTFYFYYRRLHKSLKEILFFAPALGVVAVLFLGLMPFIPLMNIIFTNMYLQYTYILLAFFVIKTYPYQQEYKFIVIILLTAAALAMVAVNALGTPFFQDRTAAENNILEAGSMIDDKYIFLGTFPKSSLPPAYYGYFAIYHNLSTAGGWAPHIKDQDYQKKLVFFKKNDFTCNELVSHINYFNIKYIVAYDNRCDMLKECGFELHTSKEKTCVYKVV